MPALFVFVLDLILAALAVEASGWIVRIGFYPDATLGLRGSTIAASAAILTASLGCYLTGLHTASILLQAKQVVARAALISVAVVIATLAAAYFIWYEPIGRVSLGIIGALHFIVLSSWRLAYGRFLARGPRIPLYPLARRRKGGML